MSLDQTDRTSEDRLQDKCRSLSILTVERLGLFEFFARLAPGFLGECSIRKALEEA